ncbi:hypothetical protein RIF29_38105 [Crotalaria pallida]|uniref:Uncharacterized protein n=1 Tax=Crotalaria pallida TaxID=3830 RepID=A0AAN9E126_CROPI
MGVRFGDLEEETNDAEEIEIDGETPTNGRDQSIARKRKATIIGRGQSQDEPSRRGRPRKSEVLPPDVENSSESEESETDSLHVDVGVEINVVKGMDRGLSNEETEGNDVQAPPSKRVLERPNNIRNREAGEIRRDETSMSGDGYIGKCNRYKQAGHNRRSCKADPPVEASTQTNIATQTQPNPQPSQSAPTNLVPIAGATQQSNPQPLSAPAAIPQTANTQPIYAPAATPYMHLLIL